MEINQTYLIKLKFELLYSGRFLSVFLIFCGQMSPPPTPPLWDIKNWEIISSTSENSYLLFLLTIENRIYIRGEFRESLGMNFFSPF